MKNFLAGHIYIAQQNFSFFIPHFSLNSFPSSLSSLRSHALILLILFIGQNLF